MEKKAKRKGMFYTIGMMLLIIPLILLVAYYVTTEKTKQDDTISKVRCDELHYFVEDVKEDMKRATVIFGRRATIYSIDHVVSTGDPLSDYNFDCSANCKVDCNKYSSRINGSEAAISELTLCGTLYGSNVTYMVNHTLSEWLDRVQNNGNEMHFNISVAINDINVIPYDAWSFAVILNTTFNVFDESGTCYYVGKNIEIQSLTSIIGLEDPLYPLNTNTYTIKYIENCSLDIPTEGVAGCSVPPSDRGTGVGTGSVVFQSYIEHTLHENPADYCASLLPKDITTQILVVDSGYGACNNYADCLNASAERHFGGVINYGPEDANAFEDKPQCPITIPFVAETCKLDNETGWGPGHGCVRPSDCDDGYISSGSCISIDNNNCSIPTYRHRVLIGMDSDRINTTCYYVSNSTLRTYGGYLGPSFFDRLDGRYNLSDKYVEQSMRYFNSSGIGFETLVSPYLLQAHGVPLNGNATWVDYLYWQKVQGCRVNTVCGAGELEFKLDDPHAQVFEQDTDCVNATFCPMGDEVCVDCIDQDNDTKWDWEDDSCSGFFVGCGKIQKCDESDTDYCSPLNGPPHDENKCGSISPTELTASQACSYYGFNTTEWHYYQITPSQDGLLNITFEGNSSGTNLLVYNYSYDGNICDKHVNIPNIESLSSIGYCVRAGETYVIALNVNSLACNIGTYTLNVSITPGCGAVMPPSITNCHVNQSIVLLNKSVNVSADVSQGTNPLDKFWFTLNSTATGVKNAVSGQNSAIWNATSLGTYAITCYANDTQNNQASSADSSLSVITTTTTLPECGLFDDFENNTGSEGWTLQGGWLIESPSGGAHSQPNASATNLNGKYPSSANMWLISRRINLSSSSTPELTFWQKRGLADGDSFYVEASTDNTNWTVLNNCTNPPSNQNYCDITDWNPSTISLTLYADKPTVWIKFGLTSDSSQGTRDFGWYIDDINVSCS